MTDKRTAGLVCPRCGAIMTYHIEVELKQDGTRIITRYYRCPVCRYRLTDSIVSLKRIDGKLVTKVVKQTNIKLKIAYKYGERKVFI